MCYKRMLKCMGFQENEELRKKLATLQAQLDKAQHQTPVRRTGSQPSPDSTKTSTPGSSSRKTPDSSLHLMSEVRGFNLIGERVSMVIQKGSITEGPNNVECGNVDDLR